MSQLARSSLIEPEFVMMTRVQRSIGPARGETEAMRVQRMNSLPFKLATQSTKRVRAGDILRFVYCMPQERAVHIDCAQGVALDPLIYERMFRTDMMRILTMVLEPERLQEVFGVSYNSSSSSTTGGTRSVGMDGKARDGIKVTAMLKGSGVSDELMKSLAGMRTNEKVDVKQHRDDYFRRLNGLYMSD